MANVPHVVIVGGGFGGLFAARRLADEPVRVTVIDRQNYHLFQPLLYQVATAGLSAGDIAAPIRAVLAGKRNVEVHLGEVTEVSLTAKTVTLADGTALAYDFLVLATGARHAYFGHPEWEQLAPGLKSLDDALEIRRRVLLAFEAAELETEPAKQAALLTFVVVGGGPTGVELAGAVAELARYTVARDFRAIDPKRARVVLVEAGDRLLTAFDAKLAQGAQKQLARLGVEVRLSTRVTGVTVEGVTLGAELLPARTVLWAAGVEASALVKKLGARARPPGPRGGEPRPHAAGPRLGLRGRRRGALRGRRWDACPASRRWPCSRAATSPRTSSPPSPDSRAGRSTTSTRASWRRWAAPPGSRRPGASSSAACSAGSRGCSCTSSSSSASGTGCWC